MIDYQERQRKQWATKRKNGTDIPWNKGKKCLFPAWNKGLTKLIDARVAKFGRSISRARLGKYSGKNSPSWKGGKPDCIDCGKKLSSYKYKYCRKCLIKHQSGKEHYNWQGGLTKENNIRMSVEYKLWRTSVFIRDNFTCVWCGYESKGSKPADIHADHIKPFSQYPELRLSIDNGRTLCIPCHKTTKTFGGRSNIISNAP